MSLEVWHPQGVCFPSPDVDPNGFKRCAAVASADDNNCGVYAASVYSGVHYDAMFNTLSRYGRQTGMGVYSDQVAHALADTLNVSHAVLTLYISCNMRLGAFLNDVAPSIKTPILIGFREHLACYRAGILFDNLVDSYKRPTFRVVKRVIGPTSALEPLLHEYIGNGAFFYTTDTVESRQYIDGRPTKYTLGSSWNQRGAFICD